MPSAPEALLPSPVCSQLILGMGANATAAPNTMVRAVSGPPVRAHILLGRGGGRASAASACGQRGRYECPVGRSEPQGPDPPHGLEPTGTVTPEDPHYSARLGDPVALASANIRGLLFLNSGLRPDLPEKSGREEGRAASQDAWQCCLILCSGSPTALPPLSPARGPSLEGTDTAPQMPWRSASHPEPPGQTGVQAGTDAAWLPSSRVGRNRAVSVSSETPASQGL